MFVSCFSHIRRDDFNGSISNLQSQMGVCVMNFSLHGSSSHRLLFGAWYCEGTLKHWDKLGWFWYELGTTLDEGVWVWDENGKYWKGLLGWVWGEVGWSGMSFGKDQEDFFWKCDWLKVQTRPQQRSQANNWPMRVKFDEKCANLLCYLCWILASNPSLSLFLSPAGQLLN